MKPQQSISILILAALTGLLISCGNIEIDNGSNLTLLVKVGDHNLELGPGERENITCKPGEYTLHIQQHTGELLTDTTISVRKAGLINAGATTYVIWRDLYGLQGDRETLLNEAWVEMDSVEYYGDFKQINPEQLYVESTWDYGLEESFPTSKSLMIFKDFSLKSKIFRQTDFVNEYSRRVGIN